MNRVSSSDATRYQRVEACMYCTYNICHAAPRSPRQLVCFQGCLALEFGFDWGKSDDTASTAHLHASGGAFEVTAFPFRG